MTALMTYKEAMDVEPVQQSVPMLLSHAEALEAEPARPTTGILTYAQAMEAGPPNPVAPTVPQAPPAAPQAVQPTAPAQAAPAAVPAVRPGAQVDAVSGAQPAEPTPAPGWPTWVNDEPGFERVTPARIEATTQKETPDSSAEWFLSMSIAELERKARIKRDLAQVAMPGGGTLAKVNLTGVREGVAQQETVNALQKLYNDPLDRHITGMMLQQLKASGHALTTDQFVAMLPVLQKSRETIRKTLTESEMKELAARKEAALSKPLLTKLRDAVVLAGLNIPSTLERFASTANVPMVNYGPAYNAEKIDAIIAQHPERQPAQLESFKELMSNPSEVAAQVIGVLPYIVGSVAAGALGTVAAGPGGGAAAMFGFTGAMEGQMWYQQAIADGASKEEAEQGRVVVGAINGMIEVAQVGRIVSLARGGKAIVVKRATQSALRKLAGKTMSSEVVHQTVRNALEEALQNAVQEYGAKVAYGKDIQPGFLGRELQNAVVGALAYGGPAMVAGVGGAGVRALGKPTAPLPGPEMPVGQVIGPRGGEAGAVVGPTAVEQRTVVPRQAGAEVGKVTSPLAPVSEFDRLYAEPATPNVAGATPNVAPPAAAPAQEAVAPQAQPEPAKPAAPVAEAADRGVQEALSQEGVKPVPEGYNKETGVGRMAVTKVNGETRFAVTVQDPETRRSVLVGNDLNADDSFALYQKLKYGEPAPSNTPSRPPSQADVPIAAPTDYSTMPRPALVAEARKRGLPVTGTAKQLRERLTASPAAETGKGEARQAWMMTKEEFRAAERVRVAEDRRLQYRDMAADAEHRGQTRLALQDNKPVPAAVLADYASEPWAKEALAKLAKPARKVKDVFPGKKVAGAEPVEVPPTLAEKAKAGETERAMGTKPLPRMEDNYRKPLSHYADTLYRETSVERATAFIPGSGAYEDMGGRVDLASDVSLALGQGGNKGVVLEFAPGKIEGQVATAKPVWKFLYDQGQAEFIAAQNEQQTYQDALRAITVKPDAKTSRPYQFRMQHTLDLLESQGWAKTKNADGSVTYRKPEAASPPSVEVPPTLAEKPKRVISEDAYQEARRVLAEAQAKLPKGKAAGFVTLPSGKELKANATVLMYHFENGVRKFTEMVKTLAAEGIERVHAWWAWQQTKAQRGRIVDMERSQGKAEAAGERKAGMKARVAAGAEQQVPGSVVEPERPILTAADALRYAMKKAEGTARPAYLAGEKATVTTHKDLAAAALEKLPRDEAAKLSRSIVNARTPMQIRLVRRAIDLLAEHYDRKTAVSALKDAVPSKTDISHMRPQYRDAVQDAVGGIDFANPTAKTVMRLAKLREYVESNPDNQVPDHVLEKLARLDKKPLSAMTSDDIRQLTNVVLHAKKLNTLTNKLIAQGRVRDLTQTVEAAVPEIQGDRQPLKPGKGGVDPEHGWVWRFFLGDWVLKQTRLAEQLGPEGQRVLDAEPREAKANYENMTQTDEGRLQRWVAEAGLPWGSRHLNDTTDMIAGKGRAPRRAVTLPDAGNLSLTDGEWTNLIGQLKDPETRAGVLEGRFDLAVQGREHIGKPKKLTATDVAFLEAQGNLPDSVHQIAAKMHERYNGEFKDRSNKAAVEGALGYEIATKEGYWPREADQSRVQRGLTPAMRKYGGALLEKLGIWKSRTEQAHTILIRDAYRQFYEHSHETAAFAAMHMAYRNAKMFIGNKDVADTIVQYHGKDALKYWQDRVETLNLLDQFGNPRDVAGLVRKLTNNVSGAVLSWKLFTSWAKQPSSALAAISTIDPQIGRSYGIFTKAVATVTTAEARQIYRLVTLESPMIRQRYRQGPAALATAEHGENIPIMGVRGFKQAALSGLEFGDKLSTRVQVQMAAFKVMGDNPGLRGRELIRRIATETERLIRETNNPTDPMDFSGIQLQARTNPFLKLGTLFTSQANTLYNLNVKHIRDFRQGPGGIAEGARLGHRLFATNILTAAYVVAVDSLYQWIRGGFGADDDKKKDTKGWFAERVLDTTEIIVGEQYGMGELAHIARRAWDRDSTYGVAGRDNAVFQTLGQIGDGLLNTGLALKQWGEGTKYKAGEHKGEPKAVESFKRGAEELVLGVTKLFGIGIDQPYAIGKGIFKATEDKKQPRTFAKRATRQRR
ncbi:MAG: hypothetical protein IMZ62_13045 [Chloroflexi bacterium]|nr:hypothetical protein [Chloroflexota bacterium]